MNSWTEIPAERLLLSSGEACKVTHAISRQSFHQREGSTVIANNKHSTRLLRSLREGESLPTADMELCIVKCFALLWEDLLVCPIDDHDTHTYIHLIYVLLQCAHKGRWLLTTRSSFPASTGFPVALGARSVSLCKNRAVSKDCAKKESQKNEYLLVDQKHHTADPDQISLSLSCSVSSS